MHHSTIRIALTLLALGLLAPVVSARCEAAQRGASDGRSDDRCGGSLAVDGDLALAGLPERERVCVLERRPERHRPPAPERR